MIAAGPAGSFRAALREHRLAVARVAGGAIVLAYTLRFFLPGLSSGFAPDDMMNIHYYWSRGPGELLRGLVLFFTTYQRPMGGVYFSTLYHFFGLDPLPYHIVITLLLLLNTYLAYRFGRLLTGSELVGGLVALGAAYHGEMEQLVYLPAFVFDVLCYTFYFLALNWYLRFRTRGEALDWKRTAVFLLLYIGALDSKEMAVTLPALALLYEALFHPPARWRPGAILHWTRTAALPALAAGALTLVYVIGKATGADTLVHMEAYRPVFTWDRYLESTTRFLNTVFYQPIENGLFRPSWVVPVWILLAYIAWRSGKRVLWWAWAFLLISPLPITFVPGRGGALLYVLLAGWALFFSVLLLGMAKLVAAEPPFRRATAAPHAVLFLLAAVCVWRASAGPTRFLGPALKRVGDQCLSIAGQLLQVQPHVKPGSRIYFVNDVYEGYDAMFITELVYHDGSVKVWLGARQPLPPASIAGMDYVFAFENGRLKKLRGD
jgi:hypothetical protein